MLHGAMSDRREPAWLPNLAGGVSIWNLAPDLNRRELFDARLLEPALEGPANLPTEVEWNVSGLEPLALARERDPQGVRVALEDLAACAERAAARFEEAGSGYDKFRGAFTLPAIDLDGGAHYFFGREDRKIFVKNWGAAPRKIAQRTALVVDCRAFADRARREIASEAIAVRSIPSKKTARWPWLALLLLVPIAIVAIYSSGDRAPPPRDPIVRPPPIEGPPREVPIDAPVAPPIREEPAPPPLPAPHQRIHFAVGEHELAPEERASLDAIAQYLRDHPGARLLLVEGHADFRGPDAGNRTLSGQRAVRVARFLTSHGIEASRLRAAGCAARHPLAENETDHGRRANRRVEFFVLDPPVGPRPHEGCEAVAIGP
jgi:hypothetical protein